jgi:hypothetical protein
VREKYGVKRWRQNIQRLMSGIKPIAVSKKNIEVSG